MQCAATKITKENDYHRTNDVQSSRLGTLHVWTHSLFIYVSKPRGARKTLPCTPSVVHTFSNKQRSM